MDAPMFYVRASCSPSGLVDTHTYVDELGNKLGKNPPQTFPAYFVITEYLIR